MHQTHSFVLWVNTLIRHDTSLHTLGYVDSYRFRDWTQCRGRGKLPARELLLKLHRAVATRRQLRRKCITLIRSHRSEWGSVCGGCCEWTWFLNFLICESWSDGGQAGEGVQVHGWVIGVALLALEGREEGRVIPPAQTDWYSCQKLEAKPKHTLTVNSVETLSHSFLLYFYCSLVSLMHLIFSLYINYGKHSSLCHLAKWDTLLDRIG